MHITNGSVHRKRLDSNQTTTSTHAQTQHNSHASNIHQQSQLSPPSRT